MKTFVMEYNQVFVIKAANEKEAFAAAIVQVREAVDSDDVVDCMFKIAEVK
jgi:hypothetical protein